MIKSADQMFADVIKHTSTQGAVSYYFRLNPSISDEKTGLFYSKVNGSAEFVSLEPTDLFLYAKDDVEHVGWFWQPYEAGRPVWMKPYYNQNNDALIISYVVPMYLDDMFIGIVGMDFDYMVLAERVHAIKIYENGFAHLEVDGAVVCNNDRAHAAAGGNMSSQYLSVSRGLANGMTLVLSASYDDIRQIRYEIAFKILLAVSVLLALFTIIAIIVAKRIVNPLEKLTAASIKLSNGDYDVEIAQSNTNEIQLLSTAFENMTMRLRQREELLRLSAHRDSLTGLRNTTSYTAWAAKFDEEIAGENARFGVIVLDLNGLKETNDKYGHDVGNELIVTAARIISDVFTNSPVFRIGGDEFLVVLQGEELEAYEELLRRFETVCADTFIEKENAKIFVRIASGFAMFDAGKDTRFAEVFKRADDAMYESKRKSKMRFLGGATNTGANTAQ